jgi:two-component system, OmpR family, response regulator
MAVLLRRGLAEEGYAADVAGTGEDAVGLAGAIPYDAIVLDVMLPGWAGSRSAGSCGPAASGPRSSC